MNSQLSIYFPSTGKKFGAQKQHYYHTSKNKIKNNSKNNKNNSNNNINNHKKETARELTLESHTITCTIKIAQKIYTGNRHSEPYCIEKCAQYFPSSVRTGPHRGLQSVY